MIVHIFLCEHTFAEHMFAYMLKKRRAFALLFYCINFNANLMPVNRP